MKTLLVIYVLAMIGFNVSARKLQDHPQPEYAHAASGFTLVQQKDNVALYERWFNYDSTTRAREIKIVFDVSTSLQPAINLLRDEARSSQWNSNLSAFKIIRESNDQWLNYIRYDLPWPFADHDCVLKYHMSALTGSRCLIAFESGAHQAFPVNKDMPRLSDIKGTWQLVQQRESIHIEYSVTTLPSHSLPRWMTDPIIRNNLLDMMVKFRALLEQLNN